MTNQIDTAYDQLFVALEALDQAMEAAIMTAPNRISLAMLDAIAESTHKEKSRSAYCIRR